MKKITFHLPGNIGNLHWDESLSDNTRAQEDAKSPMTASARFPIALHSWDKLTALFHLGVYFRDDAVHGIAGEYEGTLSLPGVLEVGKA